MSILACRRRSIFKYIIIDRDRLINSKLIIIENLNIQKFKPDELGILF
ncbi:hypothetical protein HMPREF1863_01382 [Aedoeadaptatus coxii]|uniref:Uncharacterized protein n=1 Tax=Aedoeadaptatus coxii TaxID=755172 RepID=A0A134AD75_9FIRM|nr:hypothetical protein HMPREF1863_01382 [Peptoniphilus coxii]